MLRLSVASGRYQYARRRPSTSAMGSGENTLSPAAVGGREFAAWLGLVPRQNSTSQTNNKAHNVTRCDRMIIVGPLGPSARALPWSFVILVLALSPHSSSRGLGPRRSSGTWQLSTRCSSFALAPSLSLAVGSAGRGSHSSQRRLCPISFYCYASFRHLRWCLVRFFLPDDPH